MPMIFQKLLSFFSSNKNLAIAEGIITPEQYLQIPPGERRSMRYLFSRDGRQAFAEGIITLEKYLQISWYERDTMKYLFSYDGRQAVADGIITLKEYLQIRCYERDSMKYLFSCNGRQAVAEGVITLDQYLFLYHEDRRNIIIALQDLHTRQQILNGQITIITILGLNSHRGFYFEEKRAVVDGIITLEKYLQIPSDERHTMKYLFSRDGRQAMADGIITLEKYLQIPSDERHTMEYLFSRDGWQAMVDGSITLEKYLQSPSDDRHNIKHLFSPNVLQAIADSIVTLEQFRKIPLRERDSLECLFSSDGRQAIADSIITLEQFRKIPLRERDSLKCLFSSDGRRAIADGFITLEQYLQIPWYERHTIKYLFSSAGREAITNGFITLERYLQIPLNKRSGVECFFSCDGQQAVAEGIITFEEFLQIPSDDRDSMKYLFSADGRQAVAGGIITLKRYLQIPRDDRGGIANLFFSDGRQAVTEGIITLERYLQIPLDERSDMRYLFSSDGRQAIAEGIITLERYLQIPSNERWDMRYLFSPNGWRAVTEGIITLERYLQIPSRERRNVMTALQYPDVRQRILNGEITIENIIDLHTVRGIHGVIPIFNGAQSTHTASVHQSVSESAIRLAKRYQLEITGAGLEKIIRKVQTYIKNLPVDSEKNTTAKRAVSRILAPNYIFIDPESKVSTKQLLALIYLAIHDSKNRQSNLEDAEIQFVEALYEIQRGYNLSESGIDQGGLDLYICDSGTFTKFIEKLQYIHPDCQIRFVTRESASFKLPVVAREEAKQYLKKFAKSNTEEAFIHLVTQVKEQGAEVIWEPIKINIIARMFDEFGSLYKDITDPDFIALVEAGKNIKSDDLSEFQTLEQSINQLINKLENKAKILSDRNHIPASNKAIQIVELLRSLNQEYFIEKKIDYNNYRSKALDAISQNRSILDKHRGFKQILGNLLILICTLGTGQLINKARTGNFLFFKQTDSSRHIDELCHTIKNMGMSLPIPAN